MSETTNKPEAPMSDPAAVVAGLRKVREMARYGFLKKAAIEASGFIDNAIAHIESPAREPDVPSLEDWKRDRTVRQAFVSQIGTELDRAYAKHGRAPWSRHEFYAILLEEVDELWDAIKHDEPIEHMHAELTQVAAMCFRFIETSALTNQPAAQQAVAEPERWWPESFDDDDRQAFAEAITEARKASRPPADEPARPETYEQDVAAQRTVEDHIRARQGEDEWRVGELVAGVVDALPTGMGSLRLVAALSRLILHLRPPRTEPPAFYGHGQMNSVEAIASLLVGVKERAGYPDSDSLTAGLEYGKRGRFLVEAIDWLQAENANQRLAILIERGIADRHIARVQQLQAEVERKTEEAETLRREMQAGAITLGRMSDTERLNFAEKYGGSVLTLMKLYGYNFRKAIDEARRKAEPPKSESEAP